MNKKIRVCICDDLKALCLYFKNAFLEIDDIEFVGIAHNSKDCLKLVKDVNPDILLLDIQLEAFDSGINIIPKIKQLCPDLKIIMLTIHKESDKIYKAFTYGAYGYQLKSAPFEEILKAIRDAYHNNTIAMPHEISELFINECNKINSQNASLLYMLNIATKLTVSELGILKDISLGLSYKNIAEKRFVEEITVRSQISRLLKKFGVSNIDELKSIINQLNLNLLFDRLDL